MYREIPRLLAQQTIIDSQVNIHRTPKQVHDLVLTASEDQEAAEKAEANYILSELRQGHTPQVDW